MVSFAGFRLANEAIWIGGCPQKAKNGSDNLKLIRYYENHTLCFNHNCFLPAGSTGLF